MRKFGHDESGLEVIDVVCLHLPASIRDFNPIQEETENCHLVGAGPMLSLCQPYDPDAFFAAATIVWLHIPHILTCHSGLAKLQYARHISSLTPLSGSRGSVLPANMNPLVTALLSRIQIPHPEIRLEGVQGIGDYGALARRLYGGKSWRVWRETSLRISKSAIPQRICDGRPILLSAMDSGQRRDRRTQGTEFPQFN